MSDSAYWRLCRWSDGRVSAVGEVVRDIVAVFRDVRPSRVTVRVSMAGLERLTFAKRGENALALDMAERPVVLALINGAEVKVDSNIPDDVYFICVP